MVFDVSDVFNNPKKDLKSIKLSQKRQEFHAGKSPTERATEPRCRVFEVSYCVTLNTSVLYTEI